MLDVRDKLKSFCVNDICVDKAIADKMFKIVDHHVMENGLVCGNIRGVARIFKKNIEIVNELRYVDSEFAKVSVLVLIEDIEILQEADMAKDRMKTREAIIQTLADLRIIINLLNQSGHGYEYLPPTLPFDDV